MAGDSKGRRREWDRDIRNQETQLGPAKLYVFGQVTFSLCALFFSSVKKGDDNNPFLMGLLVGRGIK